ncbi:MAG: glycosyltransferase [Candidatus Kapaibacterium sp.]
MFDWFAAVSSTTSSWHTVLWWLSVSAFGVCCVLLSISVFNLLRFARLPRVEKIGDVTQTSVAILIPARNEERCIEACVRSACEQTHRNLEVIVLNDASTDSTGAILERLATQFDNLRVISGSSLPDDWVGKSWACHQLSQATAADVLLFTDADTVHQPDTVVRSIAFLQRNALAMFSMVPYQVLSSFGEHAVIPMVHVLYFSYLPNNLIMSNPRVSLSAANGQFMCFSRRGYEAIGGHTAVWNSLVEDVFLARAVKASGQRIALVDGTDAVSCHMYTGAAEVTRGFSKNMFPATQYNLPVTLLFLGHLLHTYVLPVGTLIAGYRFSDTTMMLTSSCALAAAGVIRLMISGRFCMPNWHAIIQPVTALWTIVIGVNSVRWAYSSKGSQWKGRSYSRKGHGT